MKTLKKTFIIVVLTLICIIIFNNYNHNKSIKKLEQSGKEETTADQTKDEEEISNYVTFLALGQNLMNDSVINSGKQEDGSYNYDYIFNKYPFFWEALKNSTTWAILGAVVQILIASLIALALSRKVKGIKFVRNVYIIPNMISTAAMGIVFLQLYTPSYGIINPIIRLFNKEFRDNILLLK